MKFDRRTLFKSAGAYGITLAIPDVLRSETANEAATPAAVNEASASSGVFQEPLIVAPDNPAQWEAFRRDLAAWRKAERERLRYSDSLYTLPESRWTSRNFACCFVMLCDLEFYSPATGNYRVESFLEEGRREFGGYDSVVLWHAYPRIGVDDRNQFDFYRDMPGGLDGLRRLSRTLHDHGVKVFIDYNPWDQGTRREGKDDFDVLSMIVGETEADGVFLDTLSQGAESFRSKLDAVRRGVALESEDTVPLDVLYFHNMSWAQWYFDSQVPGILRNKWFERRHMQHQIHRWNHDHINELQMAWMNGSGMLIWENVFGSWVGWSQSDRAILRSMLPIQRRYSSLFAGEGWTPLVETSQPDLYASLWEDGSRKLWTLVNRSERSITGELLTVSHSEPCQYFDLVKGEPISVVHGHERTSLRGTVPPRGIGAILCTKADEGSDFDKFLHDQRSLHQRRSEDRTFAFRPSVQKTVERIVPAQGGKIPDGMVLIPAARFLMKVSFRTREPGFYESSTDINLDNPLLVVEFERDVVLQSYAIDAAPVTNAQYAEFLRATSYKPVHSENFLKHWKDGKVPPPGLEDHPVVYVDLDDARAYARWAGKRLPTEEEWQHAAQGSGNLRYPWGNEMLPNRCNGGETGSTMPVTAFPLGRSPFGCYDMCGNTWEWTESERSDERTRFCILKGGSFYQARGSEWYADGGPQPSEFASKYLLMWPGVDRCATIGFRCVVDN
ncbi:MAG: formylglycine-generating enzyme family protein [Acidobacteriaceae bacterium]|nr:formylglycine-generating enzyme family protein [Acidobacteriaceae bacterium]